MTVRPRSTNDAFAGHHKNRQTRTTFEVFYKHRGAKRAADLAGWYWRPAPFNDLTDEDHGPFTSSRAAYRDAMNVEN